MAKRESTGDSLNTTDLIPKADVEQHLQDTNGRQFIESVAPAMRLSNSRRSPIQHNNKHIVLISSNHNHNATRSHPRKRQSLLLFKAAILLFCLHSVSSNFDSVWSPLITGMMKRKLSLQAATKAATKTKLESISFIKPRVIKLDASIENVQSLVDDDDEEHNDKESSSEHERRAIKVSERARIAKKSLENSYQYKKWQRDPNDEGCEPLREWQETSYLSCNKIHEVDFVTQASYLARGGLNAVLKMTDIDGSTHIVKILRYKRDYTDRNFDRVRRDSLVMERATSSKYVIDMYSFCGFSQIIEFGKDGGLDYWMEDGYDDLSQIEKLQIATQISQSLTDVHNLDGDGISSMTHGDIAAKQYILIDGIFKLNDFNRGRLIHWNSKLQEPCPYTIRNNDGKFRSPEEYKYLPQTAAIDVYTLGSIFVEMITGKEAWYGYEIEVAQQAISDGMLPPLEGKINNPSDPITQVLMKAIEMCYVYEPTDRPQASNVTDFLKGEATRLGVQWDKLFEEVRRNTLTTAE